MEEGTIWGSCCPETDSVLLPKNSYAQPERQKITKLLEHVPLVIIQLSLVLHFSI